MRVLGLAFLACLCIAAPGRAVEPLWGESATALGPRVLHPGFKMRYFDAGSASSERMRMLEQELMLEYSPSASTSLRLDIPFYNNRMEGRRRGQSHSSSVTGLGDITLRAKRRFSVRRGEGSSVEHALLYGLKLPTGASDHEWSSAGGGHSHAGMRRRLDPIDQTGSGKPGILLGYAWNQETLREALWASVLWRRDLGGGFALGDTVEATGSAALWLKRPNEAADVGVKLSAGPHGQFHASDRIEGGRSAGNRFGVLGFHVTPVITRGDQIFQIGIFVPLVRSGQQHRVDYPYEIRMGFEAYF